MLFPFARPNVQFRIKNGHIRIDHARFYLTYRCRLCIITTLKRVEKASLQTCAEGLPRKIAQGSFSEDQRGGTEDAVKENRFGDFFNVTVCACHTACREAADSRWER